MTTPVKLGHFDQFSLFLSFPLIHPSSYVIIPSRCKTPGVLEVIHENDYETYTKYTEQNHSGHGYL